MSKLNPSIKVNLSDPKEGELYFVGLSSATGVAVMAHQIQRYLDIELSFYSQIMAINKDTILDSLPIFTSFEPKTNEWIKPKEDEFSLDFFLPDTTEVSKYILVQTKGNKSHLFPKISQLDFLLISNYSLISTIPIINTIPEVTVSFELNKLHIAKRYNYFRNLFFAH